MLPVSDVNQINHKQNMHLSVTTVDWVGLG